MTSTQFTNWLAEMKSAGLIRTKGDAAELLGKSREMLRLYEQRGTTERQTDLACRALLQGLAPYSN